MIIIQKESINTEMLSVSPPFNDESTHKADERILQAKIEWPRHFDFSA